MGQGLFVYSGSRNEDEYCKMVNISIAKSCQFGGVANKSGGCAFPDRGKYLNRCAFTHERREGAAIKHAWIRTCSIKMKTRVKISLRSFHHIDPVFLRSDFDVDEMKRNWRDYSSLLLLYFTNLEIFYSECILRKKYGYFEE